MQSVSHPSNMDPLDGYPLERHFITDPAVRSSHVGVRHSACFYNAKARIKYIEINSAQKEF